jgi:hypothetical protein
VKALLHRARDSFKKAWENASGWIAAPVLALRSLLHGSEKSGAAGAPMAVMSSSATPLLAEKFAASAMVVATALSGATVAAANATPQEAMRAAFATRAVVANAETPAATVESKVTPVVKESTDVEKVAALLEDIQRTAEKKKDDTRGKNDNGSGDDGPDPRRAGTKLAKSVKDAVEDLLP